MNTFYFLRHAETQWDERVPAQKWTLSERGRRAARELAARGVFDGVDIIISSDEEKAFQTALPIALRLKKDISRNAELNDLYKGEVPLPGDGFRKAVEFCFTNPCDSLFGWESAERARTRFCNVIDSMDSSHRDTTLLVVSHGCVLTLYFAKLLHKEGEGYARWKSMPFCAWGIVRGGEVVRDLLP